MFGFFWSMVLCFYRVFCFFMYKYGEFRLWDLGNVGSFGVLKEKVFGLVRKGIVI